MDKSEVGTDAHGSIAETELVDTNKSETQPELTNEEDQIEKKDEAGVKIGEADVRDDDDDDDEEFSEKLITNNSDTENSDTSNTNSKVDQTPKEVDGIEVELLADDMQEDIVQDDDTASEAIEANEGDKQRDATSNDDAELSKAEEHIELLADDFVFGEDENGTAGEADRQDSYITTTTFKPYYITESYEPKPASAGCPFSVKSSADTKEPKEDQQRTIEHRPDDQIDEDPYYYGYDPFCLTRHHVLIPAIPVMLPQWCFVPDTPDFMCPRYDLGFHIAFAHETQRDMYYRCVYGQAVMLKCPNLHYWDDERKICTLMTDFSHYQRHHSHRSHQTLHDQATHHHCQQCRRNFLRPQDLDPTAQCSDRMLLACNTDGTLSVYECPGFYYYDRHIQLRWYADLERCDYPADGDGPWSR
uniref:Uncharacterized protein n=1 Tax=Anopheles stephensi TaxID=30069 RepID=A0A182YC69_ANOST